MIVIVGGSGLFITDNLGSGELAAKKHNWHVLKQVDFSRNPDAATALLSVEPMSARIGNFTP